MAPSTALQVSVLVLYSLIFVGSLVGNTLVLYILAKKPNTRTMISFLFVNLSVADLLLTIFVVPVSVAFYFRNAKWVEGPAGDVLCRVHSYCFAIAIAASIFTLSTMTLNKFTGVMYPFRRREGCCGPKGSTLVIWFISIVFMFPILLTISSKSGDCSTDWSLLKTDQVLGNKVLYSVYFVFLYLIPLVLMCVLHSAIYCKLWRHKTPGLSIEESAKLARHQSRKVMKTLTTIVLVFAVCWFPLHAYHMIVWAFPPKYLKPRLYVMFLCFWSGHAHSAINPWISIYLDSKFHSAFLEIIGVRLTSAQPTTANITRNLESKHGTLVLWRETAL